MEWSCLKSTLNKISITDSKNTNNGSSELTLETNCKIMKSVPHFITETGRFQYKPV